MSVPPEVFAHHQPAPEGPVVAPGGWIMNVCSFTQPEHGLDFRGGDIAATHLEAPGRTHRVLNTSTDHVAGIPAALAFGPDQALYITDEGRRSIVRVGSDGSLVDFIDEFDGKALNGPNDLTFDSDGNLFFTDPWGSSATNPIGRVFGYDWAERAVVQIAAGMRFPNGIVVRDSRLYVAETYTNSVWVWNVRGSRTDSERSLFAHCPEAPGQSLVGPDGMCFDQDGNLYVAHLGTGSVVIFDRTGKEQDRIATGGVKTTNVCFGGPAHDQLFVTQENLGAVLRFRLGVAGDILNFCPSRTANHQWISMMPES